ISGFIALRLIVLRQATRGGETTPLLTTEGWAANAELLARLGAFARRVELVPSAARYDRRQRPSRTKAWQQLIDAWRSRGSGSAAMEVVGIDTVHHTETVHIRFRITGGALWYHLDQTIESWVGRYDFRSRRFSSIQDERGKHREHRFEIFPDSGFYREVGRDT